MTAEPATGSRPLYHAIADAGSVRPFGEQIEAGNPNGWPGYEEQRHAARQTSGARHAVTTGVATVAGEPCVIAGFHFSFLGGSQGVAEGAKLARAFAVAAEERVPVVSVAASGGSRMQEGTSALVQMQVVAAAIGGARQAGIPHIAVAGDPTTGGVWASLIAAADVLIAVPGARVSFSGSRTRPDGADPDSADFRADGKWARGFVDVLVPTGRLRDEVGTAVRLLSPRSRGDLAGGAPLPTGPLARLAGNAGSGQDAWGLVSRVRRRPAKRAEQWLAGYFSETSGIRGDRCGGVDEGLRCGVGRHSASGRTIAYIIQTGQRTTPAGFRTATRLLALATRFGLPVLTLIDTPGAAAAPADEAAGVGPAIAELLIAMAGSQVPVTSVVIGEGVSGGAIALVSRTDAWMARDSYLAVTAPELAAAILKLPASEIPAVAARLRLTPADLTRRGIVRGIL